MGKPEIPGDRERHAPKPPADQAKFAADVRNRDAASAAAVPARLDAPKTPAYASSAINPVATEGPSPMRKKPLSLNGFARRGAVAAGVAAALAGAAVAPAQAAYVQAGVLTCTVAPSIGLIVIERRDMTCVFSPTNTAGRAENYVGTLRKFGLTLGATAAGVIVWGVLSSVSGVPTRGALAGEYAGAGADASIVVGAGANVLLGGSNKSFALQPLSVQGQIGLNFAIGISDLILTSTP
jgi:hypothetical protein